MVGVLPLAATDLTSLHCSGHMLGSCQASSGKTLEVIVKDISVEKGSAEAEIVPVLTTISRTLVSLPHFVGLSRSTSYEGCGAS